MSAHTTHIKRRGLLISALSALLLTLSGCMFPTSNTSESSPKGRLQVVHANPQEAPIEVLVDGEVLLSVEPGEISEVSYINEGEWVLELRRAGTSSPYLTTEAIPFGSHLNVLALGLNPEGESEVFYVTDPPPAAEEGTHVGRVLDLSGIEEETKLFRGLTEVTTLPLEGQLSAFIPTEPGSAESYSLSNVNSGAPVYLEQERVESPVGGASLVVILPPAGLLTSYKISALSLR